MARGSFPWLGKVSRGLENFPVAWKNFPWLGKISRGLEKFPVARKNFPWLGKISRGLRNVSRNMKSVANVLILENSLVRATDRRSVFLKKMPVYMPKGLGNK